MPVTQIQVNPPFNVLEIFFSILGNLVEFFSFYFDDVFTLSVSQARYLPFRAFFIVSREKIHPCKTLSANVLKNILKKVAKRFGSNIILYISLHR